MNTSVSAASARLRTRARARGGGPTPSPATGLSAEQGPAIVLDLAIVYKTTPNPTSFNFVGISSARTGRCWRRRPATGQWQSRWRVHPMRIDVKYLDELINELGDEFLLAGDVRSSCWWMVFYTSWPPSTVTTSATWWCSRRRPVGYLHRPNEKCHPGHRDPDPPPGEHNLSADSRSGFRPNGLPGTCAGSREDRGWAWVGGVPGEDQAAGWHVERRYGAEAVGARMSPTAPCQRTAGMRPWTDRATGSRSVGRRARWGFQ
jgi:hypothetical protein